MLAEGSFEDPENARTIYLMAGGLALIAVVLTIGTIVWWRKIRSEHPALGPLEVMGTRRWRSHDYATRKMDLDAARPYGAAALALESSVLDPIDLQALVRSLPPKFDDLLDPAIGAHLDDGREEAVDLEPVAAAASEDGTAVAVAVGDGEDSALDVADAGSDEEGVDVDEDGVDADVDVDVDVDADLDVEPPIDYSPSSGLPIDPLLRMQSAE